MILKKEFYGRINLADKKRFWKTIKFFSKKQRSVPELHHLGKSAKTSVTKAEMLNAFFGSCFNTSTLLLHHLYLQMMLPTWFMKSLRIYCVHLVRFWASSTLLMLSGPDGISVKMLKATAASIAPSIAKLLNISHAFFSLGQLSLFQSLKIS